MLHRRQARRDLDDVTCCRPQPAQQSVDAFELRLRLLELGQEATQISRGSSRVLQFGGVALHRLAQPVELFEQVLHGRASNLVGACRVRVATNGQRSADVERASGDLDALIAAVAVLHAAFPTVPWRGRSTTLVTRDLSPTAMFWPLSFPPVTMTPLFSTAAPRSRNSDVSMSRSRRNVTIASSTSRSMILANMSLSRAWSWWR